MVDCLLVSAAGVADSFPAKTELGIHPAEIAVDTEPGIRLMKLVVDMAEPGIHSVEIAVDTAKLGIHPVEIAVDMVVDIRLMKIVVDMVVDIEPRCSPFTLYFFVVIYVKL